MSPLLLFLASFFLRWIHWINVCWPVFLFQKKIMKTGTELEDATAYAVSGGSDEIVVGSLVVSHSDRRHWSTVARRVMSTCYNQRLLSPAFGVLAIKIGLIIEGPLASAWWVFCTTLRLDLLLWSESEFSSRLVPVFYGQSDLFFFFNSFEEMGYRSVSSKFCDIPGTRSGHYNAFTGATFHYHGIRAFSVGPSVRLKRLCSK